MQVDFGKYSYMAKAIVAFIALLIPFLTAIVAGLADWRLDNGELTLILVTGGALFGGTKAVYETRNIKK